MNRKHAEIEGIVHLIHQKNKSLLDLIGKEPPVDYFTQAVALIRQDHAFEAAAFAIHEHKKNSLSFMPNAWRRELELHRHSWDGCERWWAGFPLIAWIELRPVTASRKAHLRIIAEVGPLHDYSFRKSLIETIRQGGQEQRLQRVKFPAGATDQTCRYSRFFHGNSIEIELSSGELLARDIRNLIDSFGPEINLVAASIRKL